MFLSSNMTTNKTDCNMKNTYSICFLLAAILVLPFVLSYAQNPEGERRLLILTTSGGAPAAHAPSHTDGSDDIQNATAAQKGLATATQITKLDGIAALATVDQTSIVGITGTVAQFNTAITDATLSGNNTGDQTSIVGITGTTAEFNTALTDGSFATGGGTATGSNTTDVTLAGALDYITITGQVITVGSIDLTADVTGNLPFSNIVDATGASILVGRGSAGGGGDFQEITLGSTFTMCGTTLNVSSPVGIEVTQTAGISSSSCSLADVCTCNFKLAASELNGTGTYIVHYFANMEQSSGCGVGGSIGIWTTDCGDIGVSRTQWQQSAGACAMVGTPEFSLYSHAKVVLNDCTDTIRGRFSRIGGASGSATIGNRSLYVQQIKP